MTPAGKIHKAALRDELAGKVLVGSPDLKL